MLDDHAYATQGSNPGRTASSPGSPARLEPYWQGCYSRVRALPCTATLRLNGLWERVLREPRSVRFVSGDWADLGPLLDGTDAERREAGSEGGFDLILSAETIYSTEATPRLWRLIQQQVLPLTAHSLLLTAHGSLLATYDALLTAYC